MTQEASSNLPRHIAIIMDGTRRGLTWGGRPRGGGLRAGRGGARGIIGELASLRTGDAVLCTFARGSCSRPADELRFLFGRLVDFVTKELPRLEKQGIRLRILGDKDELPFAARKTLDHACSRTAKGMGMTLNLALNYSGREELARACRLFMATGAPASEMTPESLAGHLYTAGQPDPDLVIRTSGELRISNFLLFQSAYSEYYFTPTLWPDFDREALNEALQSYAGRKRRFGGL